MAAAAHGFARVEALGVALPEVVAATAYGARALRWRGRLLACVAVHRSAEPDSIVVCVDRARRAALLAAQPAVYYLTDHYAP
ncbi:MAG: hypothetical protein JSR54_09815, partial [Proteobacteria bacterium]|nr:hypothetical protein [Pseudomonadota bacterium]